MAADIVTQLKYLKQPYQIREVGEMVAIIYDGDTVIYKSLEKKVGNDMARLLNAAFVEGFLKCGIYNNLKISK